MARPGATPSEIGAQSGCSQAWILGQHGAEERSLPANPLSKGGKATKRPVGLMYRRTVTLINTCLQHLAQWDNF